MNFKWVLQCLKKQLIILLVYYKFHFMYRYFRTRHYMPCLDGIIKNQIVRGAASLQYGTPLGGLINFRKRRRVEGK